MYCIDKVAGIIYIVHTDDVYKGKIDIHHRWKISNASQSSWGTFFTMDE